jgi:hypothetical protein
MRFVRDCMDSEGKRPARSTGGNVATRASRDLNWTSDFDSTLMSHVAEFDILATCDGRLYKRSTFPPKIFPCLNRRSLDFCR